MSLTDQQLVDEAVNAVFEAKQKIDACKTAGIDIYLSYTTKDAAGKDIIKQAKFISIDVVKAEKQSNLTINTPTPPP